MTTLITKSHLRDLIARGERDAFNALAGQQRPDLSHTDLRGLSLRGLSLREANLSGAYLRAADLRGLDLSGADLDGASLHAAQISGVLFPRDLGAEEIRLSQALGTRMRARMA